MSQVNFISTEQSISAKSWHPVKNDFFLLEAITTKTLIPRGIRVFGVGYHTEKMLLSAYRHNSQGIDECIDHDFLTMKITPLNVSNPIDMTNRTVTLSSNLYSRFDYVPNINQNDYINFWFLKLRLHITFVSFQS